MKPFKIRKITKVPEEEPQSLAVEIEFLGDGEREVFEYPLGNGWEELVDSMPKFYWHIQKKLKKRSEDNNIDVTNLDASLRNKRVLKFTKPAKVNHPSPKSLGRKK